MSFQSSDQALIDYQTYPWGRRGQSFRGPKPDLSGPYIACLGGAQTFGRYVDAPYPALLERALGGTVANLGTQAASPGFYLSDSALMEAASNAEICVVQVMGARSLSNRLFRVRLDRQPQVEAVSKALESLFPHVDFEAFTYAHNMLNEISKADPDSFAAVVAELKTAWVARTRRLLDSIQTKRVLFWFSERAPADEDRIDADAPILRYPQFVDQQMIEAVSPLVDRVVECVTSSGMPQCLRRNGETVLQTPFGSPVSENRYYPTPEMHRDAADTLRPALQDLSQAGSSVSASDRDTAEIRDGFRSI